MHLQSVALIKTQRVSMSFKLQQQQSLASSNQFLVSCPAAIGELTDTLQISLYSVVTTDQIVYLCASYSCVCKKCRTIPFAIISQNQRLMRAKLSVSNEQSYFHLGKQMVHGLKCHLREMSSGIFLRLQDKT